MKFFAMTQKKEPGCSIGYLNAVLHDHCPQHPESIDHGMLYPWYADKKNLSSFPEGMCLVVKEKSIDFSLRSDASHQYIREDFLRLLEDFGAEIKDRKEIFVISSSRREEIVRRRYFASIFAPEFYLDESIAIDALSSVVEVDEYGFIALEKLQINPKVEKEVFGIRSLESKHSTLICSEKFVAAARKMDCKGVDFVDLSIAKWPKVSSFDYRPEEILAVL